MVGIPATIDEITPAWLAEATGLSLDEAAVFTSTVLSMYLREVRFFAQLSPRQRELVVSMLRRFERAVDELRLADLL